MPSMPRRSLLRRVGATFAASVSALVLLIPAAAQADPTNLTPPVISGTLEYGQTLSATTGTWTDASSPIVKYEYEWLSCVQSLCEIIPYENASTFKLLGSMIGNSARVGVIATDAEGKIMVASSEETDTITYNGPYYAVSESVAGNGTVTGYVSGSTYGLMADNNLTCPYACGTLYHYDPETGIELVATPHPGQSFVGWSGGACSGASPTCLLTLNGNVAVTATFTGQPTKTAPPVLPERVEEDPGEGPSGSTAPPALEASAAGLSPSPADVARLLAIHEVRRHVQAQVRCEQARPCQLSLALFAGARRALIAQCAFTVAPGRNARIDFALNHQGAHLLAAHRQLPVVAQLTLSTGGRMSPLSQTHLTLT
jgi:Divergent InlB B-repeat domain